jgi:hypothetical protein
MTIKAATLAALLLSSTGIDAQSSQEPPGQRSIAIEADALSYGLDGFSGIARWSLRNGLNVALGAGQYDVPDFVVEAQDNFELAQWQATADSIQVLRIGYRFAPPLRNGAVVDGIVIDQRFDVTADRFGERTEFETRGIGISGGYYFHVGKHLYLYPTGSITRNDVRSGSNFVRGLEYDVPKTQLNLSLHVGWEWGF